MICQDCKKREASVHMTQISGNDKTSLSLCRECALARGFHSPLDNMPFPLADILSNMVKATATAAKSDPADELVCRKCGLTFDEFARQGRFGCGECYTAFRPRLESIMRKIHGASLHRGRNPETQSLTPQLDPLPVKEEERLEAELKKAIDSEDFERAAELRDKLKTVRDHAEVE
jgi:protein arginine kinase activator